MAMNLTFTFTLMILGWDLRKQKNKSDLITHIAFLQFLPSGQYGLCFGYCFSGPLPLRSHKEQVTFLGPFLGVPSLLRLHLKSARTILALKLSVTTTNMESIL